MKAYSEGLGSEPRALVGEAFDRLLDLYAKRWKDVAEKIQLERQ